MNVQIDESRLSSVAPQAIEDRANQDIVSAAGRVGDRHQAPAPARVGGLNALDLAITSEHGLLAGGFDAEHRDPFDRIIAAQSIIEGAVLVTADPAMQAFGADIL